MLSVMTEAFHRFVSSFHTENVRNVTTASFQILSNLHAMLPVDATQSSDLKLRKIIFNRKSGEDFKAGSLYTYIYFPVKFHLISYVQIFSSEVKDKHYQF
jgi:hypothetical protein